ncbi:High-affinity branched-chain amino acid transport ATP-binding protein LivF [Moorella humiferrea]|uniref:ABC transporter ATP-binding protein n=1 Tax=Neomoorella humiferrea TaxID=676965 RepID=UPI0030D08C92
MLEIEKLNVAYGDTQVIWNVDLNVQEGEIVTLIGPNGAGKTTILKAITGLIKPLSGSIRFLGGDLLLTPAYNRPKLGLVLIPEGRRLFPKMTVLENLEVAASKKDRKEETLQWVFEILPRLAERRHQLAGTLSGGEQQMLAIARGIMAQPKLLMLDEPSLGLAPIIVEQIFELLKKLNSMGITIFFVEQYVEQSLKIANRAYLCEEGRIVLHDNSNRMLDNDYIRQVYLGIAS